MKNDNYTLSVIVKAYNVQELDYYTGQTYYLESISDVLDKVLELWQDKFYKLYKATIKFNIDDKEESICILDYYKLIPSKFYKYNENKLKYDALLMLEKLKR